MEKEYHTVTPDEFSDLIGADKNAFIKEYGERVAKANLQYARFDAEERAQLVRSIHKKIEHKEFSMAGAEGKPRWETGWKENLERYVSEEHRTEALLPRYIRPHQPIRIYQDYAKTNNGDFEWQFAKIYKHWLFKKYFSTVKNIYEFGCGSAINLALLSDILPDKKFFGADWVQPSVDTVNLFAQKNQKDMSGTLFDMFEPDESFTILPESGILLFSALEQLGSNYTQFIDYVIRQKPDIVVVADTFDELYDPAVEADKCAIAFSEARNYLKHFFTYLRELEQQGKVKIIKIHRIPFGSLYIEGYSHIIWKPT